MLVHPGAVPSPSHIHVTTRGEQRTWAVQLRALLSSSPVLPSVLEEAELLREQHLPRVCQANLVLGTGALVPTAGVQQPRGLEPLSCCGGANFMQVLRTWQCSLFFPGVARPDGWDRTAEALLSPLHTIGRRGPLQDPVLEVAAQGDNSSLSGDPKQ